MKNNKHFVLTFLISMAVLAIAYAGVQTTGALTRVPAGLGALVHWLGPSDQPAVLQPGTGRALEIRDQSGTARIVVLDGGTVQFSGDTVGIITTQTLAQVLAAGSTSGASNLTIDSGQQLLLPNGTLSLPGLAFSGSVTTGLVNIPGALSRLSLVTSGAELFQVFNAGPVRVTTSLNAIGSNEAGGTSAGPVITIHPSEQNTGLYRSAANAFGFSAAGTEAVRLTANGVDAGPNSVAFGSAMGTRSSGIAEVSSGIVALRQPQIAAAEDERATIVHRMSYAALTTDTNLDRINSGYTYSNAGAGGVVTVSLPNNAINGTFFRFVSVGGNALRVDPAATDNIAYTGGAMSDGEYLSVTDGALEMVYDSSQTLWIVLRQSGTIAEETP